MNKKKITLTFGRDIKGTAIVTDLAVNRFLENVVANYFDGFTVVHCVGYWKGQKEQSFQVIILVDTMTKATIKAIEKIVDRYCFDFSQDCVMVETGNTCVDFLSELKNEK